MKAHRSQAFAYEVLRRVNRYWPIVSGLGQKVGYPVIDPALPGRRGVEDFTPVMHMIPYRNVMIDRNHKQSRTSILTSPSTRTTLCTFPRRTASSIAQSPFRVCSRGGTILRRCINLDGNGFRKSTQLVDRASALQTTIGGNFGTNFDSSLVDP